jgi:rhodanese-related sulfurtransferase
VRDFESPLILDVREALEHEKFHILGTVNLPFSTTTKEHVADVRYYFIWKLQRIFQSLKQAIQQ